MVIDLDKFAETVIKAVSEAEVFCSPKYGHKDYIIKENFIKYVTYSHVTIGAESQSIVFFRNSDDEEKCVACLITWDFDSVLLDKLFVRIYRGFIDKSAPESFYVDDFTESIYVTSFQAIINTIIEGIL